MRLSALEADFEQSPLLCDLDVDRELGRDSFDLAEGLI
jgi:hypothetical protein